MTKDFNPDWLDDPGNRFINYPIARKLAPLAAKLPFSPNQISVFHLCVGISASVALLQEQYLGSFLLFQLRGILDCLDGVLARYKKQFSPIGRSVDQFCDAASFAVLAFSCLWILVSTDQHNVAITLPAWFIFVFAYGWFTVFSTGLHDVGRRKIQAVVDGEADNIELQWRTTYLVPNKSFIIGMTQLYDSQTLKRSFPKWYSEMFQRIQDKTWTDEKVLENSKQENIDLQNKWSTGVLKKLSLKTALIGGDNVLSIFNVVLLCAAASQFLSIEWSSRYVVLTAILLGMGYAIVMVVSYLAAFREALGETLAANKEAPLHKVIRLIKTTDLSNEKLARTLAVGIGTAFAPFPGVLTPFVLLVSFLFRVNVPIAYAVNWINNPLTMVPIALLGYHVGGFVLGSTEAGNLAIRAFVENPSLEALNWSAVQSWFVPFFAGSFVLVGAVGAAVYFVTLFILSKRLKGVRA